MIREFKVRIVTDEKWRNSYWAPKTQELRKEMNIALKNFTKQFPEIKFTLAKKEECWDSNLPHMGNFPFSLIFNSSRANSLKEVLRQIGEMIRNLKIETSICFKKEQQKIIQNISSWPKEKQLLYIMGYLDNKFLYFAVTVLKKNFPVNKNELIFGFTGSVFIFDRNVGGTSGMAVVKGEHAVFSIECRGKISHMIIHELGHLMGAEDIFKDKKPFSVMNYNYIGETYQFDAENIKKIKKTIAKK